MTIYRVGDRAEFGGDIWQRIEGGWIDVDGATRTDAELIDVIIEPHEPPQNLRFLTARQIRNLPEGAAVTEGDVIWHSAEFGEPQESETGIRRSADDLAFAGVWRDYKNDLDLDMDNNQKDDEPCEGCGYWKEDCYC